MKNNFLIKHIGLFFVLFVSFIAIRAFFVSGFFPIHDDTQVARVYEMGKALKDGMFPVRWVNDLGFGYGYPVFNFYAPLAYYFGGFLVFLGINALLATKIMMATAVVLSGISMYVLGKEFWGKRGGVLCATLYIFATYHAVDIFVRGDVAEFWAYAFIPFVFLGMWKTYKKTTIFSFGLTAISYAFLMLSHNLTALMVSPFIAIFALILIVLLFLQKKPFAGFVSFISLLLGLGISAFYFLPVFFEMKFTNVLSQIGGSADFHQHFVCLGQLWQSPWGYGGSAPGCQDGFSFMLGKMHVLFAILAIPTLILLFKQKLHKAVYLGAFLCFALSLLLTLQESEIIWNTIPIMKFFQYPWRFLLLAAFFNAFLGGGTIILLDKLKGIIGSMYQTLFYIILLGLVLFVQVKFFIPQRFNGNQNDHYINYPGIQFGASNLSHEYLPKNFAVPKYLSQLPKNVFSAEMGTISLNTNLTQIKQAQIISSTATKVHINVAYFPSWKLLVDNSSVILRQVSNGMDAYIPAGKHNLILYFAETPVERAGDIVSLTSILVFLIGIIYLSTKGYGKSS